MNKKGETLLNERTIKDVGKIRCNENKQVKNYRSLLTRDNDESMTIQKLLSPISRMAQSVQYFQEHDFIPITNPKKQGQTYLAMHNQRKLNQNSPKKLSSPIISKSHINSIDSNFAIQSQPNHLNIDRSCYFSTEQQNDYNSIVKNKQTDKQMSVRKLVKILTNIDPLICMKRVALCDIRQKCQQQKQNDIESYGMRQLQYIGMLIDNQQEYHRGFHQKKIQNIKIPYYNKLVGLCSPQLITRQRLKTTDNNISQIKTKKEQLKSMSTPKNDNDNSFIFNFDIVPRLPVDNEKRISKDSYSSVNINGNQKNREKVY